jgi:DNA-binding MarR family transcriptional regulator
VAASWGASENNRRAKYYALTTAGRTQLRVETSNWKRYAAAIFAALEAPAVPRP